MKEDRGGSWRFPHSAPQGLREEGGRGERCVEKAESFPILAERGGKRKTFFSCRRKRGGDGSREECEAYMVFAPHDRGYFSSLRWRHWFLNRPKVLVERCKLSMQCLVIFLLAQNVLHSKKHYILLCHRLKYSHSPSSWKLQKSSPSFLARILVLSENFSTICLVMEALDQLSPFHRKPMQREGGKGSREKSRNPKVSRLSISRANFS